jgi:hypothetical protein
MIGPRRWATHHRRFPRGSWSAPRPGGSFLGSLPKPGPSSITWGRGFGSRERCCSARWPLGLARPACCGIQRTGQPTTWRPCSRRTRPQEDWSPQPGRSRPPWTWSKTRAKPSSCSTHLGSPCDVPAPRSRLPWGRRSGALPWGTRIQPHKGRPQQANPGLGQSAGSGAAAPWAATEPELELPCSC